MNNQDNNSADRREDSAMPSQRTLEILRQLIAFDTTSSRSNLALIEYASELLKKLGAEVITTPSPDGQKANLLASFGPIKEGGVLLSGHSDVVPVEGQQWSTDPFELVEKAERYYGRGTCDMKGFIAVVLAAAEQFARVTLLKPVFIAITYDEEIGCLGVPVLVDAMRELPVLPGFAVIGEPTSMQVAIGHKGSRGFRAHFYGNEAHSSLAPLHVNAVENAAELVVRLTDLGRKFAREGPFDDDFDVAHSTVHTGFIRGGEQVNIVPAYCRVDFEYRSLPQTDENEPENLIRRWLENEITPKMRTVNAQCGGVLERSFAIPGLATAADAEVTRLAMDLCASHAAPVKVAFGTEAGFYQSKLGIPSVVCGPGSIRQAHQPDEFISAEQLNQCEQFMGRLFMALTGE